MILRINRRYSNGTMLDATYTWSKEIDNTDTVEDLLRVDARDVQESTKDEWDTEGGRLPQQTTRGTP